MADITSIRNEIQAEIDDFLSRLNAIARRAAMSVFEQAVEGLSETGPEQAPQAAPRQVSAPQAPSRQVSALQAGPGRGRVAKPIKGPGRGGGPKRTSEELEKLTEDLYNYIATNPGYGIEDIRSGMGVAQSKELQLPVQKLLKGGRIRTVGQKRATKYFPQAGRKK